MQETPYAAPADTLRFIPLHSPADPDWRAAMKLYHASFPGKELRSDADHLRAVRDPRFRASAVRCGERFVGILFYWDYDQGSYIEYLAVDPALRGQRWGARILDAFCRGRRVVLEIDPPEDEISLRRQRFYERSGFRTNPHDYLHPSYSRPFHPHRLVLMSYPDPLKNDEARRFADFVREEVLRYSEHGQATSPRLP